jgi:hypothetical protein
MLEHDEANDRRIRAVFRQHKPSVRWNRDKMIVDQAEQADQWRAVQAEFERLYGRPSLGGELPYILKTVWIEERELRGERYDYGAQAWLSAAGDRIYG